MNKLALCLVCVMFLLLITPTVSASFIEQYHTSSSLTIGTWAVYDVIYHPAINSFKLEVIAMPTSSLILVNTTLTLYDHSQHSFYNLVTVKGTNYDSNITNFAIKMNDGTTQYLSLVPSTYISIPSYSFFFKFPIISSSLNPNDFVTMDERNLLKQNGFGIVISNTGGDVINYAFRATDMAQVINGQQTTSSWEWDKQTGLIIKYFTINTLPYSATMIATNAWQSPLNQIYKPLTLSIYLLDIYQLLAMIGGIYFVFWEIWIITAAVLLLYVFRSWIKNYITDRRRLLASPQLSKVLNKIQNQDEDVLYIEEK